MAGFLIQINLIQIENEQNIRNEIIVKQFINIVKIKLCTLK